MNDPIGYSKLIAIIVASALLFFTIAGGLLRWGLSKALGILENAVTKKELPDLLKSSGFVTQSDLKEAMSGLVTTDRLKITQYEIEKQLNSALEATRHLLRGEMQAGMAKLSAEFVDGISKMERKLEHMTDEMDSRVMLINKSTEKQIETLSAALTQAIKDNR